MNHLQELCSGELDEPCLGDEAESEPKFKSEPWVDFKIKGTSIGPTTAGCLK